MRTTLKRGLGRGAAPNGNGKAVFPPGSTSPVTFYRQPERSPRSRPALIGRIAMWLGIVFSLAVGCGLMALLFYSSRHGYDAPPRYDTTDEQTKT